MLEVRNLKKEFQMHIQGNKKIVSFEGVSFDVQPREFLAIIGPSGIGKSSLLKCIYRTYLPTSGDICYTTQNRETLNLTTADDHQILYLRSRELGYVSQFFHVIPRVSTLNVIVDALTSRGHDPKESEEKAKDYLARVGIPPSLWGMYPSTFSGGEKQRINIVQALITEPRLLLLDEPTASLDPHTKQEVVKLIRDLKQKGTAMIGIFHDYDTMEQLADSRYDFTQKSLRFEEISL
jgi:alpha-D-ribose 1-methylphosphonate 5-triphosphate synthase subunit PhnL